MMRTILLLMLSSVLAQALPLLTIPNAATFNLTPNATFNIPFSITADANSYVVINGATGLITRTPGEIYSVTDVLGVFVANNAYALAPGNSVWTENFTPQLVGSSAGAAARFLVPANVTLGPATGNLIISYELYDLDPFVDGAAQFVGGGTLSAVYTVNFTPAAAVPEPDTVIMAAVGFALLRLVTLRRRSRVAS